MRKQVGRFSVVTIDLDAIADAVNRDVSTFLKICEAINVTNQDLPSITKLLLDAGGQFSGRNAISTARNWIDNGFDLDSVGQWVSTGFWNPYVASKLNRIGIDAHEAVAISEALIHRGHFSGDNPIELLCKGDIGLEPFVMQIGRSPAYV